MSHVGLSQQDKQVGCLFFGYNSEYFKMIAKLDFLMYRA